MIFLAMFFKCIEFHPWSSLVLFRAEAFLLFRADFLAGGADVEAAGWEKYPSISQYFSTRMEANFEGMRIRAMGNISLRETV